jgi:GT2 family glycosyltransferase
VVIDQSDAGLTPGTHDGPTFRWTAGRHFSAAMNWMQRDAQRRGLSRLAFMHTDAETTPGTLERLLATAGDLDSRGARWGVIFTCYDALCCFNPAAIREVGCWDESFGWYVADVDYYNRLRWHGWSHEQLDGAEVVHHGSQTLRALPPGERAAVERDHAWAVDHYRHKWGCHWADHPAGRLFPVPYNGQP